MAGVDLGLQLMPRSIADHPWVGLEVDFPFPEVGRGKVVRCLTHPQGRLMFDVQFPWPVPPIHNFQVVLVDVPDYHQDTHRFYGFELQRLVEIGRHDG